MSETKPLHCLECKHPDGLELDYNLFAEDTKKLIHVFKKVGEKFSLGSEQSGVAIHQGVPMDCLVETGKKVEVKA